MMVAETVSLADFNVLDGLIGMIVLFCFGLGLLRSITGELMLAGVWLCSFVAAQLLRDQLAAVMTPYVPATDYLGVMTLGVIFVSCLIAGSFMVKWIGISLPGTHFSLRILGGLFGIIKAAILLVILLRLGKHFSLQESAIYQQSQLIQWLPLEETWLGKIVHQMMDRLLAINPL